MNSIGQLELVVSNCLRNPENNELGLPSFLNLQRINKINHTPKLETDDETFEFEFLNDSYISKLKEYTKEDFFKIEKNKAKYFIRIERLERLAEGILEVKLDNIEDNISLEHIRSYHEGVSKLDFEKPMKMKLSLTPGQVESLQNVSLISPEVCSIYSDFIFELDLPDNWEDRLKKYNNLVEDSLPDHIKKRTNKIKNLKNQNVSNSTIKKEIKKDDLKFYNDNKNTIESVHRVLNEHHQIINDSINKIIDTYSNLLGNHEYVLTFENIIYFGLDPNENLIFNKNANPLRPIYKGDFEKYRRGRELLPFNDLFQKEFKEELKKECNLKDYEKKSKYLLKESMLLFQNGFYKNAFEQASQALEVLLREFILDSGSVTEKEMENSKNFNMKTMLSEEFDKAVKRLDADIDSKEKNLFSREIYRKIIEYNNNDNNKSLTKLRNSSIHQADPEVRDPYIAYLGILVYSEAIDYIISECWKNQNNNQSILGSNQLVFFKPYLKNIINGINPKDTKNQVKEGFEIAKKYLRKEELDSIIKYSEKGSVASSK